MATSSCTPDSQNSAAANLVDISAGGEEEVHSSVRSDATITEGKATITFPGESTVFYNPVQEFNRDLSVAILHQTVVDRRAIIEQRNSPTNSSTNNLSAADSTTVGQQKLSKKSRFHDPEVKGIRVLEALAASGLRAIRYAKEVSGIDRVIANDFSQTAVQCMRQNAAENGVADLVLPTYSDAVIVMHENKRMDKQFHVVDLDPYGTATPFLDAAVQCVMDEGILMVTCTDVAVLCGNTPESCYAKYGAMSLRAKCCHEIALRILLQCIETQANRYGRYVQPLLSISVDFYVRVFVRVNTGAAIAKQSCCKRSMIFQCAGCESYQLQPLAKRVDTAKGGVKYVNALAPVVPGLCENCGGKHHMAGPIWSAPLHEVGFVRRLLDSVSNTSGDDGQLEHLKTSQRIIGLLSVVLEELQDVPLYYVHDRLASILHCTVPPMNTFRSALLHAGYRVSISHANPRAVKTDAPSHVIWDVMRCWVANGQKQEDTKKQDDDRLGQQSPARAILGKEPKLQANFAFHPYSDPVSRHEGILRFQMKPHKYWGPKCKAKGSISSKRASNYVPPNETSSNGNHRQKQQQMEDDPRKKAKVEPSPSSMENDDHLSDDT